MGVVTPKVFGRLPLDTAAPRRRRWDARSRKKIHPYVSRPQKKWWLDSRNPWTKLDSLFSLVVILRFVDFWNPVKGRNLLCRFHVNMGLREGIRV